MATETRRQHPLLTHLPLVLVLLIAAALRLWALDSSALWWDEGLNAYLAHLTPGRLLTMSNAVLDSNPPTYRLLLGVWLRLVGDGVVNLRLPSVLIGLATIVVVYAWGCWLGGTPTGTLAALLMALNPMAIYRQREAKAYPLVALFAALSCYLWLRYILNKTRPSRLNWLLYTLCTALTIGSHYYALFMCAAQGAGLVVWLLLERGPRRQFWSSVGRWLLTQVIAFGVWVPWMALSYQAAIGGAAEAGVGRDSLALLPYFRQTLFALAAGPEARRWAAGLALGALAVPVIWVLVRSQRHARADTETSEALAFQMWPLVALIVVPVVLGYIAQRVLSFMDSRFLFYVVPALSVLVALGLAKLRQAAIPVGLALLLAWTVALPAAYTSYGTPEDDLRPIAEAIRRYVQPDDSVVVAYIWQEGILRMYAPEVNAHYELGWYSTDNVGSEMTALFAQHPHVWLVSFNMSPQHPLNTAGWWLEHNTARMFYQVNGNNQISGYVCCDLPQIETQEAVLDEGVTLMYTPLSAQVSTGEVLCLPLEWETNALADASASSDYAVFVHLADAQGKPWAQSDGAPQQGFRGFETFAAGEVVYDPRSLLITADVPPGNYRLLVGVYQRNNGQRLTVMQGAQSGADCVEIGTVVVTAQ